MPATLFDNRRPLRSLLALVALRMPILDQIASLTKQNNPDLAAVFSLEHGRSRRLPVERASDTWEDDLVPFRETLINVEK